MRRAWSIRSSQTCVDTSINVVGNGDGSADGIVAGNTPLTNRPSRSACAWVGPTEGKSGRPTPDYYSGGKHPSLSHFISATGKTRSPGGGRIEESRRAEHFFVL